MSKFDKPYESYGNQGQGLTAKEQNERDKVRSPEGIAAVSADYNEKRQKGNEEEDAMFTKYFDRYDKESVLHFMMRDYERMFDKNKKIPFKLNDIYYTLGKNNDGRYIPVRKKCKTINGEKCRLCDDSKKNNTDDCSETDLTSQYVWRKKNGFSKAFGKSANTYDPGPMPTRKEVFDTANIMSWGGGKTKRKHCKSKRKQCKSKRKGKGSKRHKTRRHSKK